MAARKAKAEAEEQTKAEQEAEAAEAEAEAKPKRRARPRTTKPEQTEPEREQEAAAVPEQPEREQEAAAEPEQPERERARGPDKAEEDNAEPTRAEIIGEYREIYRRCMTDDPKSFDARGAAHALEQISKLLGLAAPERDADESTIVLRLSGEAAELGQ